MPAKLFINVTDLLEYLRQHNRPSGIQRVVFELGQALHLAAPDRVRFVCCVGGAKDFETVSWTDIASGFAYVTDQRPPVRKTDALRTVTPIPVGPVSLFLAMVRSQADVFRQFGKLGTLLVRHVFTHQSVSEKTFPTQEEGQPLTALLQPGDMFFVPGAPWATEDYAETVRWLRDQHRATFSLLIHDMFPVTNPEWCDRSVISPFTTWHQAVLPLADHVFTTSTAVARDVEAYTVRERIPLQNAVTRIGAGMGFRREATVPRTYSQHPPRRTYVLFVSTIEARKNHLLMFRVWKRLMDESNGVDVPTLVFAGRKGWLVESLFQQLDNTRWLDGKIIHIPSPTDEELAALYENCLFTVFPSLAEGWGLPVAESLSFGQPCLASATTAIPEAGGGFARYFDPENMADAFRAISETLDDRNGLEAWRDQIRKDFIPADWRSCASIILSKLEPEK
ncbi:glycosyltransferase family 4 protein [Acetobacter sp.]|uniref:glycosyltransferase family 4 protein n=1 Tax=Acetobacter sp. TaxID=440 RepID=UPI0039ED8678